MSPLLRLPTEILLQIIKKVLPSDLENFCRCCKELEGISARALQNHQSMKTRHSTIFCGTSDESLTILHSSQHPVTILRAILEDDHYVHYPKEIRIGSCGPHMYDEADPQVKTETLAAIQEVGNQIVALVSKSPYLKDEDTVDRWIKVIASGDGRACAALAISLLPNLRSITMANFSGQDDEMIEMLGGISRASIEAPPAKLPALSKLSGVRILNSSREWDNFVLLEFFAQLPSMRTLYGKNIEGEFSAIRSCPRDFEPRHLGVTEIVLEQSSVAAASFAELFSESTALQKVKYEAITPETGLDFAFWEPDVIVALLLRYATDTLIELDLTLHDRQFRTIDFHHEEFMGSLRRFTSLKHVRVDSALFFHKVARTWFFDGSGGPENDFSYAEDPTTDPPEPLAKVLPIAIETLVIVGDLTTWNATKLFDGLPGLKESRLPKLQSVTFESPGEWLVLAEVKDVEKACGISLRCSETVA
jgi:hypothetical protein